MPPSRILFSKGGNERCFREAKAFWEGEGGVEEDEAGDTLEPEEGLTIRLLCWVDGFFHRGALSKRQYHAILPQVST